MREPMPPVFFSRQEGIGVITLDRPQALNAFSQKLMRSLDGALDVAADETLRVLIVTGDGGAFGAGGDLLEFAAFLAPGSAPLPAALQYYQYALEKREKLPVPFVVAVMAPQLPAAWSSCFAVTSCWRRRRPGSTTVTRVTSAVFLLAALNGRPVRQGARMTRGVRDSGCDSLGAGGQ
jgi:hypothetical protein